MRIDEAARLLTEGGIEDSTREARLIFSHYTGISPALLLTEQGDFDNVNIAEAVRRRAKREPLQYILGEAYFYREKYKVNEGCLIPREDTEILVDYAVKHTPKGESILDLCTGSGCVAISVVKNTVATFATAVDISDDALKLARENAAQNGVAERVRFSKQDATTPGEALDGKYFAILSNPPYVTEEEYRHLEPELYHEPKIAFVGGEDGGIFYKALIPTYKPYLKPCGFMAFEIGRDQGQMLSALADENGFSCEILKDFSGNDRVAVLKPKTL